MPAAQKLAERVERAGVDGRSLRDKREVTPAEHRLGWSAGLSLDESKLRGSQLLQWLIETANSRGMQMKELAAELGVSYGYISQLRNGIKPISGLSESIVNAAAEFLGLPRIAVMIAADIVKPTDFYSETMDMEGLVDASLKVIQSDPEWGPRMDPEITRGNLRSKLFVVNLYEEATGSRLLMHRANVKKYIEIMQKEFADD